MRWRTGDTSPPPPFFFVRGVCRVVCDGAAAELSAELYCHLACITSVAGRCNPCCLPTTPQAAEIFIIVPNHNRLKPGRAWLTCELWVKPSCPGRLCRGLTHEIRTQYHTGPTGCKRYRRHIRCSSQQHTRLRSQSAPQQTSRLQIWQGYDEMALSKNPSVLSPRRVRSFKTIKHIRVSRAYLRHIFGGCMWVEDRTLKWR